MLESNSKIVAQSKRHEKKEAFDYDASAARPHSVAVIDNIIIKEEISISSESEDEKIDRVDFQDPSQGQPPEIGAQKVLEQLMFAAKHKRAYTERKLLKQEANRLVEGQSFEPASAGGKMLHLRAPESEDRALLIPSSHAKSSQQPQANMPPYSRATLSSQQQFNNQSVEPIVQVVNALLAEPDGDEDLEASTSGHSDERARNDKVSCWKRLFFCLCCRRVSKVNREEAAEAGQGGQAFHHI
jgi:hypothetical protein